MTEKTIESRARMMVSTHLGVSPDAIRLDSGFVADLGSDSLDSIELGLAVEDEFDVPEVDDETIERIFDQGTFGDMVTWLIGIVPADPVT